jgi:hypothetical protein
MWSGVEGFIQNLGELLESKRSQDAHDIGIMGEIEIESLV